MIPTTGALFHSENLIGRATVRFWPPDRLGPLDRQPLYPRSQVESAIEAVKLTSPIDGQSRLRIADALHAANYAMFAPCVGSSAPA